jgi:hypothetical protein
MTHEQHLRLIEIGDGLIAVLDAVDNLGTGDRKTALGLQSAALAIGRALKQLVEELDPIIDREAEEGEG